MNSTRYDEARSLLPSSTNVRLVLFLAVLACATAITCTYLATRHDRWIVHIGASLCILLDTETGESWQFSPGTGWKPLTRIEHP